MPGVAEALFGCEFWQGGDHWDGLERLEGGLNRNLLQGGDGHDFEQLAGFCVVFVSIDLF